MPTAEYVAVPADEHLDSATAVSLADLVEPAVAEVRAELDRTERRAVPLLAAAGAALAGALTLLTTDRTGPAFAASAVAVLALSGAVAALLLVLRPGGTRLMTGPALWARYVGDPTGLVEVLTDPAAYTARAYAGRLTALSAVAATTDRRARAAVHLLLLGVAALAAAALLP